MHFITLRINITGWHFMPSRLASGLLLIRQETLYGLNVMKKLLIIVAMLAGLGAIETRLNGAYAAPGAAGFPEVVEGDKLRFGNLIVELFGIRAPKPGMICRAGSVEFQCGAAASQALDRIINNYAIKCQQVSDVQLFPMLTECTIGRNDLNRLILRAGWAMVDMVSCDSHPSCATYLRDQEFAKENRKGIWMGTPPSELVALAAKPTLEEIQSADDKAKRKANGDSPRHLFGSAFTVDLAEDMKRANAPDRTLLSFLENTF
ncbi:MULTISPECIES: thermonuclease family protein [unclassified Thalassospira]|uniref:thermonuclease family protein n=1 Tax=unclassified Thalassospira TaxID=2648997 RepID=UPI00257F971D|nr:thermonuclease family protein [Thalassospira sp.]